MKKIISIFALCIALCGTASANDKKSVTVNGGADIVSSYIWRGSYNAGASFQPTLEGSICGVTLGAWGSTDFIGKDKKEVDLYLKYAYKGLTIGVTDYWWEGEGAFRYFNYENGQTSHRWEGNISYQLPFEKFPLIISWNTMFAGNDYKADGKRAYSTYIELDYPFSVRSINMNVTVGATPWNSPSILAKENKGFSVCNVALGAAKEIRFSDKFSMPLFTRLTFNPALQDIYLVFGLSLRFSN